MTGNTGEVHRFSAMVGPKEITYETGKLAEQAGGAVVVRMGDTMVLATATMSAHPREGVDFFPLSVDYEERMYAAGRIPGSFFRREGRPSEAAILIDRVTDRPLRPLFPKDLHHEVQVILTSLSHDQEHHADMLCINGASAALMISNIPFGGPVAACRVGLIDGELVINPTISEMENSTLDLRLAGTADAINMVEAGAQEVDEATMLRALDLGHQAIQELIVLQNQMAEQVGKEKAAYEVTEVNEVLRSEVFGKIEGDIKRIVADITDRKERNAAVDELRDRVLAEYEAAASEDAPPDLKAIREFISDALKAEIRRRILEDGIRPDGRDYVTIRTLSADVSQIPRVHGSGLFKRGQTQVMSVATLGTPRDAQELDNLNPEDSKRYLHHYNFPPFSTGETWFLRGPKRREIGHGALAETALRTMLPPEDEFPYTVRVVSEVLSSNGSTSMASVCGSTLALMDAGVPIIRPVGGIAMGLISDGERYAVLTDIQGMEDHLGDMDFKVAGTSEGITALQMDIKIKGIPADVMSQALQQARDARLQILKVITDVIPEPRENLSDYAPRMTVLHIDPEKIGAVIGPGGKVVRGIQEKTGVKIDIENDGTVFVAGVDGPSADLAVEMIQNLIEEPEVGRIYTGKVNRIEPYGAFVEFLPGRDGMVHISQIADYRVEKIEDEVRMGDEIMVMVTDVDPSGKVRLSRQAVLEGWTAEEAREKDKGGSRGGSRRSGGGGSRDRRGGSGRRSGGGDRRSSGGSSGSSGSSGGSRNRD